MTRIERVNSIVGRLAAVSAAILLTASSFAAGDDAGFVLIRDDLQTETIRLVELKQRKLVHVDGEAGFRTVDLDRCIAVFAPTARGISSTTGVLELADGQEFPGQAISNARPTDDVLAWTHPWLGRMDVPLSLVKRVRFSADAPLAETGDADVILLSNGDRQDGFVVSIGDPISLEVEGPDGHSVLDIPLDRVAAVAMVTPDREPEGRRVWFRDGTVIDVRSIRVGDDGHVRLSTRTDWLELESLSGTLSVDDVAAVLFAPRGMLPLATLQPASVDGPPSRYRIPKPELLDDDAPLGLSRITCQGPLTIRYVTPPGTRRLAAKARIPSSARRWGDYELVVRDDDLVVFQARLNAAHPVTSLNVPLTGTELTIELTEGGYGPIQDVLVLEQAMLLLEAGD